MFHLCTSLSGACSYNSGSLDATVNLAAPMRILHSVIGEEGTTGVVKIYDEQRRASETYDLSGRRLPAGSKRGLVIENGKVVFKK